MSSSKHSLSSRHLFGNGTFLIGLASLCFISSMIFEYIHNVVFNSPSTIGGTAFMFTILGFVLIYFMFKFLPEFSVNETWLKYIVYSLAGLLYLYLISYDSSFLIFIFPIIVGVFGPNKKR